MLGDEEFTKDINEYLSLIEYDELEITVQSEEVLKRILANKTDISILSGN